MSVDTQHTHTPFEQSVDLTRLLFMCPPGFEAGQEVCMFLFHMWSFRPCVSPGSSDVCVSCSIQCVYVCVCGGGVPVSHRAEALEATELPSFLQRGSHSTQLLSEDTGQTTHQKLQLPR